MLIRAVRNMILLGILVNFNISIFGQVAFNKHFDADSTLDASFCCFQTLDEGYINAGTWYNPSFGIGGAFIIRTNCIGDTIWKKVYDLSSTGAEGFESGLELPDGNYIICGYLQDTVQLTGNAFLSKINYKGEIIWLKTYGGAINESAKMVKSTPDNGFIFSGYSSSYTNGGNDYYLVKTDSEGNLQWQKHYGGVNDEVAYSIDFTKDGGYILGGKTNSYGFGGVDLFMIKVDANGDSLWQKTFGTTGDDYSETVISTLDSGYVMVGGTADSYGSYDAYMIKTDSLGNKLWDKVYGKTSNYEMLKYVIQLPDSSYTLSGSYWPDNTLKYQGWLVKTNKYGDSLWCKTYGNSGVSDYIYEMCKTSDGGYALAGQYNRIGPPYQDMWLIKTDSLGCDSAICNFGCNACVYIQPRIWVSTTQSCYPQTTFSFRDTSDFATSWFWDFGDMATSTEKDPVHTYASAGTFTIKHIAYYSNCSDSTEIIINIMHPDSTEVFPSICQGQSYYAGGDYQTAQGAYYDTLQNQAGCDSIIITNLTVNPIPVTPVITVQSDTLFSSSPAGNQWYNQNGLIPGATDSIYILTDTLNNDFYVMVEINGCFSDTSNMLHLNWTYYNIMQANSFIEIFPNPAKDEIVIDLHFASEKLTQIAITDLYGKEVIPMVEENIHHEKKIVNISNLQPSMYMVKVKTPETMFVKKIIVIR